jgi:hypothetical protein
MSYPPLELNQIQEGVLPVDMSPLDIPVAKLNLAQRIVVGARSVITEDLAKKDDTLGML